MQFLKYLSSPCKWNDKPVVLEKDSICDMNVIPDIPERLKGRRYITGITLDPFYSFSFIIFWVFFFAVATESLKGKRTPKSVH